jgi:hypothetical protein
MDTAEIYDEEEVFNNNHDNTNNDSFFDNDPDNVNALLRESNVDGSTLSVNPELIQELRALKRSIYNAVVFGPPVGSEAAQDVRLLQEYESLLLELNNLLDSIFQPDAPPVEAQQFARFPSSVQGNAQAYCTKIVEFKNTNTYPYLNDILLDLFDRLLKEHPY